MPAGDEDWDIAEASGVGTARSAQCFSQLGPAAILILGDRFEIFSAAIAARLLRFPIIHLSGGDITKGAIDDVLRHFIKKIIHLHFATN